MNVIVGLVAKFEEDAAIIVGKLRSGGDEVFTFKIPKIYKLEDGTLIGFHKDDEVAVTLFEDEAETVTFFLTSKFEDKVFYVSFLKKEDHYEIVEQKLVDAVDFNVQL